MEKPIDMYTYEEWTKFPDYYYRKKKIGHYTVEMIAGTNRGGWIVIWDPTLDIFTGRQDIPFMLFANALEEFNSLSLVSNVLRLNRKAVEAGV
jgi:hypothetical protein